MDFSRGKKYKKDVIQFAANLEDNLCSLHYDLSAHKYTHGGYARFMVHDPKARVIHKAVVRDRVVHRLLYNYLLPRFNKIWLDCSFSCRPGFGQYKSISAVESALNKATRNYTKICWAVKCDVKKFFNNIDHEVLRRLLARQVRDKKMTDLLDKIIESFSSFSNKGIPIGNHTSQVFANVYLHELDLFVKHHLKKRYYFRYADDFICSTESLAEAKSFVERAGDFIKNVLCLEIHPQKIIIRQSNWGIDWLGQVFLPGYKVLRPSTRRRVVKKIACAARYLSGSEKLYGMLSSYNGLLRPVASKSVNNIICQTVAFYRGISYN